MVIGKIEDIAVYHSVVEDFGPILRAVLGGSRCIAALGPVYETDPASAVLAPFLRSARESGIEPDSLNIYTLAPGHAINKAESLRFKAISTWDGSHRDAEDWTRAGLVLEIAARVGIPLRDGSRAHVKWKMNGTITGRFGVEPGGFNPLIISREKPEEPRPHSLWRSKIVPSSNNHVIASIDFSAIDLCSMISIVPGLSDVYAEAADLHDRTAEILGCDRDTAKNNLFVYAYGGSVDTGLLDIFNDKLPQLRKFTSGMEHGVFARAVQKTSAIAFKAALSKALPLLIGNDIRPMFAVHDELTLDVLRDAKWNIEAVSKALEEGASERIGVKYTSRTKYGFDYSEAKL